MSTKPLSDKSRLTKLALSNVRSKLAETLYLKTGVDFTRPVQIYALPTMRCNAKCVMCDYWKAQNREELPAETWIQALKSLKKFTGTYHIQFSAAEPLLKPDIFEIFDYCNSDGISAGVTTNGLALTTDNIRRIIECNLFNVNISLDSMDASIHDSIRGVDGMLEKVKANIAELVAANNAAGRRVRIILRPLVCAETLAGLGELVEYAHQMGLTGINFQPITGNSERIQQMLDVDRDLLERVVAELIEASNSGMPIINSTPAMLRWIPYFQSQLAPPSESRCTVSLRNLTMLAGGDVTTCGVVESCIGNIRDGDIGKMWKSQKARKLRAQLTRCRKLCAATCVEKRRWRDYLNMFKKFSRK